MFKQKSDREPQDTFNKNESLMFTALIRNDHLSEVPDHRKHSKTTMKMQMLKYFIIMFLLIITSVNGVFVSTSYYEQCNAFEGQLHDEYSRPGVWSSVCGVVT